MFTVLQYSIIFLIQLCKRNLLTHLQILVILLSNTTACCYKKNFLAIKLVCNFIAGAGAGAGAGLRQLRSANQEILLICSQSATIKYERTLVEIFNSIIPQNIGFNISYIRRIYWNISILFLHISLSHQRNTTQVLKWQCHGL